MNRLNNKSMDRDDLFTEKARPVVKDLNRLIQKLYSKRLYMTSWYGTLPKDSIEWGWASFLFKRSSARVGFENRGMDYAPLPESADDRRIPWYLYWEIFWVLTQGPRLSSRSRILDAGGTSSLFSCYLASLGHEVHSVDLNPRLVANSKKIARTMGWDLHAYKMNMNQLQFDNEYFDHAYSICVFEHLDHSAKQAALREIARVLKPTGVLSITFDYRNPAPSLMGTGPDASPRNRLSSWEDIQRSFLSTGLYRLRGNQGFHDNGKTYLVDPDRGNVRYSFGAVFLEKNRLS